MAHNLKIYSNDDRATSYGIYVQGGSYSTPTKVATVQRIIPNFTLSDGKYLVTSDNKYFNVVIPASSSSITLIEESPYTPISGGACN